jgi:hypothetical protein
MHSFGKKVPNAKELLAGNTLREFIANANALASDKKSIKVFETGEYKDFKQLNPNGSKTWSPHYFGGAVEFLAECFFEVFGAKYNLAGIKSTDDYDEAMDDGGVDHMAHTLTKKNYGKTRVAKVGAPVYIQTKGTLDPRKEFTTNDGARLPNFFMNAQSKAINSGAAYSARYILFTTGKGIHWKLNENSGELCEVVNFTAIKKLVDGNVVFWNTMRAKAGAPEQKFDSPVDPEAACNIIENDKS